MLFFSLYLCPLIGEFFSMLLEHILLFFFFRWPLSPFCKITRREISLDFRVFIFGGWMACFA
jgi:hypothetical protein